MKRKERSAGEEEAEVGHEGRDAGFHAVAEVAEVRLGVHERLTPLQNLQSNK